MFLRIKSKFSAAHKLPNYNGDCANLHGHTWKVVFEIEGPMFFATSEVLSKIDIKEGTKTVIIRMRNIPSLDITALKELKKTYAYLKEKGVKVIFSHANMQPLSVMKKAGFYDEVGEKYFVENIDAALEAAQKMNIE